MYSTSSWKELDCLGDPRGIALSPFIPVRRRRRGDERQGQERTAIAIVATLRFMGGSPFRGLRQPNEPSREIPRPCCLSENFATSYPPRPTVLLAPCQGVPLPAKRGSGEYSAP